MLSFSVDAQNLSTKEVSEAYAEAMKSDVTTFLGIPVDGTVSSMKQKLIAKGFKQDSNMLSGQFNGQDVYLSIVANKGYLLLCINKLKAITPSIRYAVNSVIAFSYLHSTMEVAVLLMTFFLVVVFFFIRTLLFIRCKILVTLHDAVAIYVNIDGGGGTHIQVGRLTLTFLKLIYIVDNLIRRPLGGFDHSFGIIRVIL